MTDVAPATVTNPPLPFTKDAIIGRLQHQATNGPAYVQHSATKSLAQLKGLYAEARYEARLAYEATRDALRDAAQNVTDQALTGYERVTELMNGAEVTEEDLGGFARFVKRNRDAEEDDEEAARQEDDDVP